MVKIIEITKRIKYSKQMDIKKKSFNDFIYIDRIGESTVRRNSNIDQFYSDRSRVLFCSSFRRLQQKAQVFSLESNASIRTRLTHSLEVSDIGRTLANSIAYELKEKNLLSEENIPIVVSIVENACLLHDIGNPPFGHFGESAIKYWAEDFKNTIMELKKFTRNQKKVFELLMEDFIQFDGNPQGFRTVTKLHSERDKNGLNLTYSTLLCMLKYSRAAGEKRDSLKDVNDDIIKKAGYFQSEKDLVEKIYSKCNLDIHHRYPFTYIMEAADDIAYCMSDIADGIEKGILTEKDFIEAFLKEWAGTYGYANCDVPVKIPDVNNTKGFNLDISIPWSKEASKEAIDNFIDHKNEIYLGTAQSLINKDGNMGKVLEIIKNSRIILSCTR